MPKRIQRKRTKGWRMPAGAVYVGRPSKWGNPFTGPDAFEKYKKIALGKATEKNMLAWEQAGGDLCVLYTITEKGVDLAKLIGKDLVCWCPLSEPCHADVLLEIVNGV